MAQGYPRQWRVELLITEDIKYMPDFAKHIIVWTIENGLKSLGIVRVVQIGEWKAKEGDHV